MKIERENSKWHKAVIVSDSSNSDSKDFEIRVRKDIRPLTNQSSSAEINWPGIGSVDVATARIFAQALLQACIEADAMNSRE